MRILLSALFVCGVLVLGVTGAEVPESVARLRVAMEKTLDGCRDQMLLENIAAFGQYSNGLVKASEKCRVVGDLDGVVALGDEIKRVSRAVAIPSEDEAGTPEPVRLARGEYRAAIGKSKAAFERKQQALLQGYVADLDTLKKRLTVEGKIEEALAVKQVMASQKALVELKPAGVASPVPNEEMVPCAACSGVGKKLGPCAKCSGAGLCVTCSGAGFRKQGMAGLADRMPCMTCRKSGKCAPCGGAGKVPGQACEACRGAGKVPGQARVPGVSLGDPGLGGASRPPSWLSEGESKSTMLAAGARLKDSSARAADVVDVDLEKVLLNADAYLGKVCRSSVPFRSSSGDVFHVSVRSDIQTTVPLWAYSEQEAVTLRGMAGALQNGSQIVVTYGVLRADRLLLFRASLQR